MTRNTVLRLLIVASLLWNPSSAMSQEKSPAGDVERLDHSGRWLVDGNGRVVILHGVNMVNRVTRPYTLSAAGFGEEDAAILKAEGFNTVRVGFFYEAIEPESGNYDESYLDDMQKTVEMLHRHGMWSLIDFHQDLYGSVLGGRGLPKWATLIDGLPTKPQATFPSDYFVEPAVHRAFDSFWENRKGPGDVGLQDRYAAAWAHVAKRFATVPGVLGYEIMNEPFPGSDWRESAKISGGKDFDNELTSFTQKVIDAIRKVDARTLVFYEPSVTWVLGTPSHVGPLKGDRLGFAFHSYVNMPRDLGMAEQYAARTGHALLATEWGANTRPAKIAAWAKDMDDAMMSWQYWTWANKAPYKIPGGGPLGNLPAGPENQGLVLDLSKPRKAPNLHEDRMDAVSRPYPPAVAGTPQKYSFDAEKHVLTLKYSSVAVAGRTLADGAETEIYLPKRHYPKGYTVTVKGTKVMSATDERVLRLRGEPKATEVTVQVDPK